MSFDGNLIGAAAMVITVAASLMAAYYRRAYRSLMVERDASSCAGAAGRDCALRKQEAAVRRLNARLSATLQTIPDLMFEVSREGRYLNIWARDRSLLVATEELLLNHTVSERLPAAAAETIMAALCEADETGVSCGEVICLDVPAGRRWFELSASKKAHAEGGEPRFFVLSRDITERKEAAEKLKRAHEFTERLINAIPDPILVKDRQHRWLFLNDACCARLGHAREELIGKSVRDYLPREQADVCWETDEAVFSSRRENVSEEFITDASGALRCQETKKAIVEGPDGDILVGIIRDITERKRMEDDLRAREEEFRALAENSPDLIVRYDRDCRRIYVNAAYQAHRRTSVGSALGGTPLDSDVLSAANRRPFYDAVAGVVASSIPADLELSGKRPDGSAIAYAVRIVPEFDKAGQVVSVLTVGRDITGLKETERRLLESRSLLQELSARREEAREEERRRIARDLHEELGQLLTALRMDVAMLSMEFGNDLPELRERSKAMQALADKTIQRVRDVVMALRPTTLDMGMEAGLRWLVDEFARGTGAECVLQLPEDGIEDFADSHATALFRIVQESLSNVARHADAGRVVVVLTRLSDDWELTVHDDGCGFDPSVRGEKSYGLLGIRERALLLAGDIHIASAPGEGTLIRVKFSPGAAILH